MHARGRDSRSVNWSIFRAISPKGWSSYVAYDFRIVYVYANSFRPISNDVAVNAGVMGSPFLSHFPLSMVLIPGFHSLRGRHGVLYVVQEECFR